MQQAVMSWSETVHENKRWAQPRMRSKSPWKANSIHLDLTNSHFERYKDVNNLYKKPKSKIIRHHSSPIVLQEQASKRKTRNLEDLSMVYTLEESRSMMLSQRSQRSNASISIKSTQDVSGTQCSLGKRLFEEAVERASTTLGSTTNSTCTDWNTCSNNSLYKLPSASNSSLTGNKSAGPPYVNRSKRQKHNGPTVVGSPIYNKQNTELGTLRSESSLSGGSILNKTKLVPELKKHLDTVTASYKVVPAQNNDLNPVPSVTKNDEFILVPVNVEENVKNKDVPILSRNMLEGFHYRPKSDLSGNKLSKPTFKKYTSDVLSPSKDRAMSLSSENLSITIPAVKIQTTVAEAEISKKKATTGRRISTVADPTKGGKPNQLETGLLTVERRSSTSSRPSSACSSRSSRSRPRSARIKTWVDDATISSSLSGHLSEDKHAEEDPSSAAAVAANQKVISGVNQLQLTGILDKRDKKAASGEKELKIQFAPDNIMIEDQVISLRDLHQQRLSLPDFICPSSEEKSRQAAVREWIEKSSFPWALRTVPLL